VCGLSEKKKMTSTTFGSRLGNDIFEKDPFFQEFRKKTEERRSSFDRVQMERPRAGSSGAKEEGHFYDIKNDEKNFEVKLDVSNFKPEEITVKTADDEVVVTGKHEEQKCEHEKISREQTRRCKLPKDVDPNNVTAELDKKGILTVKAPKTRLPTAGERKVFVKLLK